MNHTTDTTSPARVSGVTSGQLLREARLRAGLTQADLEARTGKDRASIARWERDDVSPAFETLRDLLRACEFDLALVPFVRPNEDAELEEQLRLTPQERVDRFYGGKGRRRWGRRSR